MKITMNTLDGVTLKTKNKYVNEDIAVAVDQAVVDEIYQDGFQEGVASVPPNKMPSLIDGSLTELTEKDLVGITSLRDYAFAYMTSLAGVTFPNNITNIGNYAFKDCTSLTEVTIPNSVTNLGNNAFHTCSNLTSITFEENSQLTSIGTYAFGSTKITNLIIPNSVTSINSHMCYSCKNLESVVLPNTLTTMNASLFANCSALKSIEIPSTVTSINGSVFQNCSSLTSLTIPASVTSIGSQALIIGSSTNKATITFLSTTPLTIDSNIMEKYRLEKIVVPKGCRDAYISATNWGDFAEYIVESDT